MEVIHQVNAYERVIIRLQTDGTLQIIKQEYSKHGSGYWRGDQWVGHHIQLAPDAIEPVMRAIQRLHKLSVLV